MIPSKKSLLIGLSVALVWFFFGPGLSFAATYETTNSTTTTARIRPVGVSSDRSICQTFSPTASLFADSLSAWFSVGSGGYNAYFQLSGPFGSEASALASAPTSTPGNLWNVGNMGTAGTSPTYLTGATSTPVLFSSGSWYVVCFKTTGGSTSIVEYLYGNSSGGGASAGGGASGGGGSGGASAKGSGAGGGGAGGKLNGLAGFTGLLMFVGFV